MTFRIPADPFHKRRPRFLDRDAVHQNRSALIPNRTFMETIANQMKALVLPRMPSEIMSSVRAKEVLLQHCPHI